MQSNRSGLLSRKKSLILVLLFLVALSFSTVFAQDRFIIGTGDANNTVIDTTTGLMWERTPLSNFLNWQSAKSYCENLNGSDGRGGYEDWRLSNTLEAISLIDFDYARYYTPSVHSHAISNTAGNGTLTYADPFILSSASYIAFGFWTSVRLDEGLNKYAWVVQSHSGELLLKDVSEGTQFIPWCVRGNMSSSENCILQTSCPSVDCPSYPECKENECPVCQTCLNEKEIVYLNNCTEKNLSVQSSFQNNSQVSGETNESVLDEDKNIGLIVTFIIMGLIIVCLIVFVFMNRTKLFPD